MRPAAAKTIHRCQGDTLDSAIVDFPTSTREHMHYVGLSRVRNSSNLHILNLNEWKIKVSKNVATEMNRLRAEATLVPLASLQDVEIRPQICVPPTLLNGSNPSTVCVATGEAQIKFHLQRILPKLLKTSKKPSLAHGTILHLL